MNLHGKRIAITGAFGSLGSAVVAAAHAAGAKVAALDHAANAPAALAAHAAHIGGGVDLADGTAAQTALDAAAAALGGLDALVNIAGTFRWQTLEGGELETWDLLYRVNLRSAAAASKAALPHLRKSEAGRIINIGANAAIKAGAGMGAYAASKAGVARLTESLAEELKADTSITVNAVLPSILDTAPNRADMPDADFSRWVKPEQLAQVIVFLVSDDAAAITGALLPVTGRV
ncbi:MAG: SDR family NAD(P)-dependent oxidoreductase [Dokdonella sp.]|uniref:SDR family NAD(P)-dependent oxidoreductase n=1 Tax=Dokdonella sp. TaxID=2291710 RepID=UPI0025C16EF8|nr:SDR family NAD(P)-dependent oxidoreductase [Dokdonella sp.]MBZ0222797.1 SDR family NAD(P)-dependent oxidoreductase [Dokdonella sp.]MCC7254674.1 SDR family NAD(P)-dependent oxidoreductase [Dokdonella sp.]